MFKFGYFAGLMILTGEALAGYTGMLNVVHNCKIARPSPFLIDANFGDVSSIHSLVGTSQPVLEQSNKSFHRCRWNSDLQNGSGNSENDLNHGPPPVNSYGYSGSFSGSGPPPNFAVPQFDFSGFLGNYLDSLSRYHQEFLKNLQANAQGAQGGYGQPGGFGGSFGGGSGGTYQGGYSGADGGSSSFPIPQGGGGSYGYGGSGGASSSASFGPGGIHQTASVYPENPNSPNIDTRFGGSESGGQPEGGFHSVFTSSQSQTANVDGKPVTVHKASTTVNDNGKVTTYTAKNP